MPTKRQYLTLLLFFPLLASAQIFNSSEQEIFNFFNVSSNRIELNGGKTSVELSVYTKNGRPYFGEKSGDTTAVKKNGVFLKFGITETGSLVNIEDLDFKEKNGLFAGIEYVHAMDKVFLEDGFYPQNLKAYNIDFNIGYRKLNVLNPETSTTNIETPLDVSFSSSYGLYWLKNLKRNYFFYPQANLSTRLITYNERSLTDKFTDLDNSMIDNGFLISDGKFDGVVGDYNNSTQLYQASVSFPFITNYKHKWIPNIMIAASASWEYASDIERTRYHSGFSLSLLGQTFKPIENSDDREFSVPSFLTFGVDWLNTNGDYSSPNYYLSGSFKF